MNRRAFVNLLLTLAVLPRWVSGEIPTFNRDVAPILFAQCVECHHPGTSAPFDFTTYFEVKKRAQLIARVTAKRYMPPWLPEAGHGDFFGERRLANEQIGTLARWAKTGMREGAATDLPPLPELPGEWQLGPPDLVVTMPQPFDLPADGPDVYRNFVLPNVVAADRYVRAIELRPGKSRAMHHVFVFVDETGDARRLESLEGVPGFPGMVAGRGAHNPGGFVSWQPGRRPSEVPQGMSWQLRKNADLILQMHLRPTGVVERVQPSVGLYFTDQRPVRPNMIMLLRSAAIDIPAGARDYPIETSYRLPVDVQLVGLLPHMHYLGKDVHGSAELPDGTKQELLLINHWDFNWQSDYRYREPVRLPKGTTLRMRSTFDNSAQNVRNPNQPPKRVQYGLQTSDEMGELWFWIETRTPAELAILERDYITNWGLPDTVEQSEALLRRDPKDAFTRTELGASLAGLGKINEALPHLRQAVADNPNIQRAHFVLGTVLLGQRRFIEAATALASAAELAPNDAPAQANLGIALLAHGKVDQARKHLERALALDPANQIARNALEQARTVQPK